ncbi:hypothetical protein INT47_010370 [Mucor saturninus]|uniref:Uncharacterized protein n=1 Tax=Mucor saturninus TaxID=64648 RepID=A0A8H7QK01_9FUNG|nr:hypothetical protein INT47_010370 [Mucor saturninus]
MIVDEPNVLESHVTLRTNLTEPINDMDMDMPLEPMIVNEPDALKSHVTIRTNLTEPINDMDMDMPLEVELRLKKSKAQKRRFVANINQANRKRPKK